MNTHTLKSIILILMAVAIIAAFASVSMALELCPGDTCRIEWDAGENCDYYTVMVSENGGPLTFFAETALLQVAYDPPPGTETVTAEIIGMNTCGGSALPAVATEALVIKQDPTPASNVRFATASQP
jgi:hypothetical protein